MAGPQPPHTQAPHPQAPHPQPPHPQAPHHRTGPGRPPVDPAAARRAGGLVSRFGLLALAAVLATSLPLPWSIAGLAFTVASLVVGVRALVATVRARLRATSIVVLSAGLALVGVLLLAQLVQLAFYPATADYQECQGAALTDRAEEQCDAEYRGGVLDQLFGR